MNDLKTRAGITPTPPPGTGHKAWYRKLERTLGAIERSQELLATQEEFSKANLRSLDARANMNRDSINYFPVTATQACRIGFFSDTDSRAMAWDQVELSNTRACLGRLYFKIPGGIAYGQHWLNVKFENSLVRVPFRILTKEEEKTLSKNFKDIRKQVQEAFKPKKGS